MEIVVLVKQVPDTYSERKLRADGTLDRDAADAVIDEIDSRGVEVGLQLTEQHGGEVTVLTMGPDRATETLRKALAMGAHKAIHVVDDALAGSDAWQTAQTIAAALGTTTFDIVITGNEASDGKTGTVPAMLAERLGLPLVTNARKLTVEGSALAAEKEIDGGYADVSAPLPALVSVSEKITEPRYPNFKGIMAAKSKPVTTLSVADLKLDGGAGGAASLSRIVSSAPKPPREAGQKVTDDGTGGQRVAEFLIAERII